MPDVDGSYRYCLYTSPIREPRREASLGTHTDDGKRMVIWQCTAGRLDED